MVLTKWFKAWITPAEKAGVSKRVYKKVMLGTRQQYWPLWVYMNALPSTSGEQCLYCHFTSGTVTFFLDLGTFFLLTAPGHWKQLQNFSGSVSENSRHLWLAHPEASFIFSVLLSFTMRKICVCQCSRGALTVVWVKIWLHCQDASSSSPHWFMFHIHGMRQSSKTRKSANSTQISVQLSSPRKQQQKPLDF